MKPTYIKRNPIVTIAGFLHLCNTDPTTIPPSFHEVIQKEHTYLFLFCVSTMEANGERGDKPDKKTNNRPEIEQQDMEKTNFF